MLIHQTVTSINPKNLSTVRELFLEYEAELGIDLCFQGFEEELKLLPGKYSAPTGELRLYFSDGEVIGCGAIRQIDETYCELKRIYVRPAYRGHGLGRAITLDLIQVADNLGYAKVRLDTLRRLVPAVTLYQTLGFIEIAPYNDTPIEDVLYLERAI